MSYKKNNSFGTLLKKLRNEKGYSIKSLSPKLNVNYSYLSKLENGHSKPSKDFIERAATFLNYNKDELMVRAGKIPDDIVEIIRNNPRKAIEYLRKEFGE